MRFKYFALIILIVCFTGLISAESWKIYSDASLSLAQSAYSDNWAGTELSSLTWFGNSNSYAEMQITRYMNSRTTLKLAFGQTHTQKTDEDGNKYWTKPDKTTDKIDLESVMKFTLGYYLDPYASVRMESQFLDYTQSSMDNTRIVNPVLFTESAGASKTLMKKENEDLNARLGLALRQYIDMHSVKTIFPKEFENLTTNDGGLEFVLEYNKTVDLTKSTFNSRLQVFQAMFNSKSDELNDDWKAPDLSWENSLNTKLFAFITASLYIQLKYEQEEVKAAQFKETLGMGFTFQLF